MKERRYSARHPSDFPVYIRYDKRRLFKAAAANLSDNGMFLDVQALTLPVDTLIELEFRALGRDWLVPAMVVHGTHRGIGVIFREPRPELSQGLLQQPGNGRHPVAFASLPSAVATRDGSDINLNR